MTQVSNFSLLPGDVVSEILIYSATEALPVEVVRVFLRFLRNVPIPPCWWMISVARRDDFIHLLRTSIPTFVEPSLPMRIRSIASKNGMMMLPHSINVDLYLSKKGSSATWGWLHNSGLTVLFEEEKVNFDLLRGIRISSLTLGISGSVGYSIDLRHLLVDEILINEPGCSGMALILPESVRRVQFVLIPPYPYIMESSVTLTFSSPMMICGPNVIVSGEQVINSFCLPTDPLGRRTITWVSVA